MTAKSARRQAIVIFVAVLLILPLEAQRRRFGSAPPSGGGVEYDGRFTIVRLWYAHYGGWSFDYPDMEQNLTLILKELTGIRARPDASQILRMDDPELLKYPIAYLSEPGYWYPSDDEAEGLRT